MEVLLTLINERLVGEITGNPRELKAIHRACSPKSNLFNYVSLGRDIVCRRGDFNARKIQFDYVCDRTSPTDIQINSFLDNNLMIPRADFFEELEGLIQKRTYHCDDCDYWTFHIDQISCPHDRGSVG